MQNHWIFGVPYWPLDKLLYFNKVRRWNNESTGVWSKRDPKLKLVRHNEFCATSFFGCSPGYQGFDMSSVIQKGVWKGMNRYEKVKDFAKLKPPQRTWSQAMGAGSENQWVYGSVNPSSSPMIGLWWSPSPSISASSRQGWVWWVNGCFWIMKHLTHPDTLIKH